MDRSSATWHNKTVLDRGRSTLIKRGRIVVPNHGGLRKDLMKEAHNSSWAGHPGVERMYALQYHVYFWPKMEDDIEAFVKTCHVCQIVKTKCKNEASLLQPLPVPEGPWLSVSMDFIFGFLKVDGKTSIMVVVDRFSKYSIFLLHLNFGHQKLPLICSTNMWLSILVFRLTS